MRESSFIVWCEGLLIAVTPKQAQNALTVAMSATTVSVSRLFFADLPLRETGQRLRSPGCFTLPLDGWKVSCASPPLQQQLSCAERSLPFEYPSHTHIHTHTHHSSLLLLLFFLYSNIAQEKTWQNALYRLEPMQRVLQILSGSSLCTQ